MKALIVYYSKTGFTEKYAKWLREALNCDIAIYKIRNTLDFTEYDTVLFGGGFYAGTIGGLDWFKSRLRELKDKTVIVFATGASNPQSPDVIKTIQNNFTESQLAQIQTFYLQSGLNYQQMGVFDKWMMSLFRNMLEKKQEKNEYEEEMCRLVQSSFDRTSKDALKPILEYIEWVNKKVSPSDTP